MQVKSNISSKLSTMEKLITSNITNKSFTLHKFDDFCGKEMLDVDLQSWTHFFAWYPVVLRYRWVLFCVIPCKRFRLLLIDIYGKFEHCISSFGKEITWNVVAFSKFSTFRKLYLVQKLTFNFTNLGLEH